MLLRCRPLPSPKTSPRPLLSYPSSFAPTGPTPISSPPTSPPPHPPPLLATTVAKSGKGKPPAARGRRRERLPEMGKGGGCVPSKRRQPPAAAPSSASAAAAAPRAAPDEEVTAAAAVTGRKVRLYIVFYSMYGHVESLARRAAAGAGAVDGVEVVLRRVPETLPPEVLEKMQASAKDPVVPVIASAANLQEADGILFGFPTRTRGTVPWPCRFFDYTGSLWEEQKPAEKPAGFFVSTGTQGQETTVLVIWSKRHIQHKMS